MPIFRPVEPAHERRPDPRKGPGEGPDQWPLSERFCQGEVRESKWEGTAVPGILDGDIHSENPAEMKRKADFWCDFACDGCCCALLNCIYRLFPSRLCFEHPMQPPPLCNLPCTLVQRDSKRADLSRTMMSTIYLSTAPIVSSV